jgi:hypothetical protein
MQAMPYSPGFIDSLSECLEVGKRRTPNFIGVAVLLTGNCLTRRDSNFPQHADTVSRFFHRANQLRFKFSVRNDMERMLVLYPQERFMKTLMHLRKRLAHLAVGPLVGALIAALLLIVLMLNINNDENSIGQTKSEKQSWGSVEVRTEAVSLVI